MPTAIVEQSKREFARQQSATLRHETLTGLARQQARLALVRVDWSRLFAVAVALPFALLFVVIWALMLFPRCGRLRRIGRHGRAFLAYDWKNLTGLRGRLVSALHLGSLPRAWNLLRGDVALVGPRLEPWSQSPSRERSVRRCRDAAPGMLSLFSLRQMTNIDFDDELTTEVGYVETRSWRKDIGLVLRIALASLYGGGSQVVSPVIHHLGVRIDNLRMQEACEWIAKRAQWRGRAAQVSFVNAHCMNVSCTDDLYRDVLQRSELVLADGIGMKLAGRLLRQPVAQNVNGTDLFPLLCDILRRQGSSVYLLGGEPGVAEEVERWVNTNYPGCKVAGTHHGFIPANEEPLVAEAIRQSGAEVLLVAMGVPGQEKWIARNLQSSGVAVAIGVGGLFDFYSNRIPRAPQWLRELGMEWTYRLACEPRRMWRRYIVGNVIFLGRVMQQRRVDSIRFAEKTR
jgi:N-acetylglucosaminyldiphosphoundecaprenol N-acetyl-beta-D-mannosaminyltransferase